MEGWARYWAAIYEHVADALEQDPALREAARVVRYEDLCGTPRDTLEALFAHAGLAVSGNTLEQAAAGLHAPTYYQPRFNDRERSLIEAITAPVARRFGYSTGGG